MILLSKVTKKCVHFVNSELIASISLELVFVYQKNIDTM